MRTITHGDVVAAARAVSYLPPEAQSRMVRNLLDRAHAADLFRKRMRRAHPFWGNGSLMAAALGCVPTLQDPFISDRHYLETMAVVIETTLDWRNRARKQ